MNENEGTLLFVYNADSGLFNTATDIAHKIFSPETYQCDLCALTYGYFEIRSEWKEFIEGLAVNSEFLHRDQIANYPEIDPSRLPAIYRRFDDAWLLCLGPGEIAACEDLGALKTRIVEGCVRKE